MTLSNIYRRCNRFLIWIRSGSILRRAEHDFDEAWPSISWVFANADAVYIGCVGVGAVWLLEAKLLEIAMKQRELAESLFMRHICSDNPLLAAYCMAGLGRMHSPLIPIAASKLRSRSEILRYLGGCIGQDLSLGQFAQYIEYNFSP